MPKIFFLYLGGAHTHLVHPWLQLCLRAWELNLLKDGAFGYTLTTTANLELLNLKSDAPSIIVQKTENKSLQTMQYMYTARIKSQVLFAN